MFPLHDDNPTEIFPAITIGLIGACIIVFAYQISLSGQASELIVYRLGVIPAVLFGRAEVSPAMNALPAEATVFSSMFLHGGWLHLIGNMLYLWIFGNNVEDAMGHVRFVTFYLVCGIIAVFSHALIEPSSQIPMIGASGAISGVLGAYALIYPHAKVLVILPIGFYLQLLRLPAYWVLGAWFAIQIISSLMTPAGQPGVAWFAHIGGFVAGLVLVILFKRSDIRLFQDGAG